MKTKRAAKGYVCRTCKAPIAKGDQYALKSIRLGDTGVPGDDGTVRIWEPYRVTVPVCAKCANPAGGAA